MKNFSTWMLVMFMVMFWVFRIVVALAGELNWNFAFAPLNQTVEVILLFVTLLCIVLVIKRKIVGGLIYLTAYGLYFGMDIVSNIQVILAAMGGSADLTTYANLFVSLIGMILAIAVIMDLVMDKSRKLNPKDKKTDWFYTNSQYDRELDERADKNQYRTL